MAVIALMMTIGASAQFYLYCSDGNVIKVDSISMIAPGEPEEPDTPTEPEEPTNPSAGIGVFSVGEGKQVTFSKGNLQYTQSTNTWSFASTQWDMIGTDNVIGGSVSSDPRDGDSKLGDALADKIDLFGWSTSATNFGVSTSTDWENGYSGSFIDWGTNKIGSDAPDTWRTLTKNEWEYLLKYRPNADFLRGIAQVNGVNGLIFLPDNWVCPADITFQPFWHYSMGVEYYAACQTFTAEQWSKLETAGAVFLPASGYRSGLNMELVQAYGFYWTTSASNVRDVYALRIFSSGSNVYSFDRICGGSVRLVKDVEGGGATPDTPDTPDTPENTENGHEYVDLGLSVKWATCNVGANSPEEYGDYFAWGEVEPKEVYDWSTYKWCELKYHSENNYSAFLTKYCTKSDCGHGQFVDNKMILESTDDAAIVNWGGIWRMPTKEEQDELREQCTWKWTTLNGVNGYLVTSKINGYTDRSIFLPETGSKEGGVYGNLTYGYYWSSSLKAEAPYSAHYILFDSNNVGYRDFKRSIGLPVRPVCQ